MDYQKTAKEIVLNYVNKHLDKTDNVQVTLDDVYLVWFCKTLQNWKRWYPLLCPTACIMKLRTTVTRKKYILMHTRNLITRRLTNLKFNSVNIS